MVHCQCGPSLALVLYNITDNVPISKSANTASISIDSLGHELQNFVIKYEQGSRQASQLVSSEALQIREVVMRQSGKTEQAIQAHVTRTSANFEQRFERQIEQASHARLKNGLLKSLKYPGMNERANQIEVAHAQTFRWVFADPDNFDHSNDGDRQIERIREFPVHLMSLKSPGLNERVNQIQGPHALTVRWMFADTDNFSHNNDGDRASKSRKLNTRRASRRGDSTGHSTHEKSKERPPKIVWSSFTDWLQSDHSIYWITGKPGSGKSTLAKFILSDSRTKSLLENWRHDAIIASHYFWRPGELLQRSIKGMLCSITYQLIISLPNALEYISTSVAGLGEKDTDTDWSVSELQRMCLGLIRHCGKPLCLSIDGLDECGPEDNQQKLLEILEEFKLPDVKIIASSRNEPVFEEQFRHEPQLRVHDLTAGDLSTYATDVLRKDVYEQIRDAIRDELVANAEGVFLWLVLAVQSINRGLSHKDSFEVLRNRIRSLPKGLKDLYNDIWARLNSHDDVYQKSAAVYFKLAIAARNTKLKCLKYGWSTMMIMLASFVETYSESVPKSVASATQLLSKCEEFHKVVWVRCAGLLNLYGKPSSYSKREGSRGAERALIEYASRGVRLQFTHRSAHDFLVDTVEGKKILSYDESSPEDIEIRIITARLRIVELLGRLIPSHAIQSRVKCIRYEPQELGVYLADLSTISDIRDSAAKELVSFCYELYSSSRLTTTHFHSTTGRATIHEDLRPTRIAVFFGTAAYYPNLARYTSSIIEKHLIGSETRSSILLSVVEPRLGLFPLKFVRWLLTLPEVDVNLKCSLIGIQNWERRIPRLEEIGPVDHMKESPFARLLGFGLVALDWKVAHTTGHRYKTTQFLPLVSDFVLQGADLCSTLFLAFRLGQTGWPRFFQIPGMTLLEWSRFNQTDDDILCVMTFRATTVIKRMLARLQITGSGCNGPNINEHKHPSSEDEYSSADVEQAMSFLSQRCQEYGRGANDRIIGFLEPHGNLADMPYRQVNDQDSAQLMKIIWRCIFEDRSPSDALAVGCREVRARSPFSSVGFRDYLRDSECFDELAAYKLLLESRQGMILPLIASTFRFWK